MTLGGKLRSNSIITGLLAYGLSACFIVVGLVVLATGDMGIGETRYIRTSVDIVGSDRIAFGFALLGAGYILVRWAFRAPGAHRHWADEVQVFAIFAVAGYVAYRVGAAS